MQLNQLLRISNDAVEALNKLFRPIVTPEYIGWSVPLPKKYKSMLIVDYSEDKDWDLLPLNPKKKLKKRTIIKALKFLIDKGWLTPEPEVFEEFAPQLRVDMNNAIIIPKDDYIGTDEIADSIAGMSIEYDDDISGINIE